MSTEVHHQGQSPAPTEANATANANANVVNAFNEKEGEVVRTNINVNPHQAGVCPVKPEFLEPAPPKVLLDAEQRTRGMNKGAEREHSVLVAGTERPTLEGETNFFAGKALFQIKAALKSAKQLQRNNSNNNNNNWQSRNNNSSNPSDEKSNPPANSHSVTDPAATATTALPEAGTASSLVPGTKRPREETETGEDGKSPLTSSLARCSPHSSSSCSSPSASNDNPASLVEKTKDTEGDIGGVVLPLLRHRPPASEEHWRELVAAQARHRGLFANKLVLAPLTTVGNLPFRRICKEFGADVTISEMAVVYNLNRTQKSEWSLLRRHECEDIFGIQLAVSNPQEAAQCAMALEASEFSYDFLDINGGCPIDAMNRNGCGCALMERRGQRLPQVVRNLVSYQSKPVSIKCRIGADENDPTLHREISQFDSYGASAVTIHGRSRKQRYTKLADWQYTERCAGLTPLPVIGNGDILGYEDIERHRAECPHVNSFMIGRGALIKPWIFREVKSGQTIDMSSSERFEMLKKFCQYGLAHWGSDARGVMNTRRFLCEWLSFLHRYVPAGVLEHLPQKMNERPPYYRGRDEVETMMASASATDWIALSELLLGPAEPTFRFTPKHKSNSYAVVNGSGAVDEAFTAEG